MSTNTNRTGGFLGDPAEALNPPASAGGCCGSPATTTDTAEQTQVSTCCGTAAEARAEGSCCGSAAKEQAVASGAGCCG
ncbi:hypothetical protein [Micromonospora sp. NPDC049497]|uniref:hypothetical protein n=1 Tax=Micromonospora sp. NPDC049497 TaxID=3364273 RepID=UPI0037AD7EA6